MSLEPKFPKLPTIGIGSDHGKGSPIYIIDRANAVCADFAIEFRQSRKGLVRLIEDIGIFSRILNKPCLKKSTVPDDHTVFEMT